MSQQSVQEKGGKLGPLMATIVISVAIAGYFTGLQAPMTDYRTMAEDSLATPGPSSVIALPSNLLTGTDVLPATHYSQMPLVIRRLADERKENADWTERFGPLRQPNDLDEQIVITPSDKNFALEVRKRNRAFNGAPPTVPHAIDQMSSESCIVCHGPGFNIASLRASRMSHQFLSECSQCHVESNPTHLPASLFGETTFVGLPAPKAGPRAFPGAPPQVPHPTWMRVDCLSCHGPIGEYGIRTTHPWRQDCQQCHAVASELEQTQPNSTPAFLQPLKVITQ